MNSINIYKSAIYTENAFNTIGSVEDSKKDKTEDKKIVMGTDSIEIGQKNDNIINTKKAIDSFNETCEQTGETTWNGYVQANMALYFNTIKIDMRDKGISVPDFTLDGSNSENNDFTGFVDRMKDYVNSLLENNEVNSLPSNFFEFCDTYKENLIKNGCK